MKARQLMLLGCLAAFSTSFAWGDYAGGLSEYRMGNFASAVYAWRESAEQGDSRSQYRLGEMYAKGQGVEKQLSQAKKWFFLAAESGNVDAQRRLASLYLSRTAAGNDPESAVRWLRKAAEQNDGESAFLLGQLYYSGTGVNRDFMQAARWFTVAAEQDVVPAQNNLGSLYESGIGVEKNDSEAVRWYRRAAKAGDAYGQNNLGNMYLEGKGVSRNYAWATFWFSMSAVQGNQASIEHLNQSVSHLQKKSVAVETANVRAGNSTQYPIIDKVHSGDRLPILGNGDGWTQVYLESSQRLGWISSSLLE